MVGSIIRKEILENLLSLRFILSLSLIICLFAASGLVFVGRFDEESADYWRKTNENLSELRGECSDALYKVAFHKQTIWREPKLLSLCSDGFEKSLPNCFRFNVFRADLPHRRGRSNFTLPYFSNIDWVFIISTILGFVALVFTYDSISGEKETGTLRLMLASTIPRYKVLLGKYFGAMFTLGIPLIVALCISLIIVISSENVIIDSTTWLKILAIVLLSLLYLSIFVFLGMFVSSRTAHSTNSMVILLSIWVVLVILMPSFGRIASEVSGSNPTVEKLERKLSEVFNQMLSDVMAGKFGKNAGSMDNNPTSPINDPPARARWRTAWANADNKALEDHHNKMMAQALSGRNVTSISPTVIYQRASEAIAGTGISRCVNLIQQTKQYQATLKEFIRSFPREISYADF